MRGLQHLILRRDFWICLRLYGTVIGFPSKLNINVAERFEFELLWTGHECPRVRIKLRNQKRPGNSARDGYRPPTHKKLCTTSCKQTEPSIWKTRGVRARATEAEIPFGFRRMVSLISSLGNSLEEPSNSLYATASNWTSQPQKCGIAGRWQQIICL